MREIGTEDFAKVMPEYCGVIISKKPTVKAKKGKLEAEEASFNFEVLEQVDRERSCYGYPWHWEREPRASSRSGTGSSCCWAMLSSLIFVAQTKKTKAH